jgi:hypothetical protein
MADRQVMAQRLQAFARVEAVYAGEATWDDFATEFTDAVDPPIADLVRLIRLEPERGGLAGVPESAYREYRSQLERAVLRLEAAAGAADSAR